ncbi:4-coumarate--CoA ligase 3-like [Daphnia pulex]|uniref:4-coumarate--CoA ligase 3-like n=1 Tax=Daphnia pulex TaxID=6669 RepID=UPI001EDFB8FF|nr:4-coumarate--CoA ligase 3-like [Daphnia pulex]
MVGYNLLRLKSIETSLKAIVQTIRFTNGSVERIRNVSRVQCRTISGVSSTSTSVDKNIVYSRHQDFDFRSQTVIQRIFEKASLWPNLTAMECGLTGRKYTYGQLIQLIRRFGSSLTRMGFKKGEVFGIILPNLPEFPIVLLGAAGIGMPVTTVNPTYTVEEIARQLQLSGATAVVTTPQLAETLRQVAKLCPEIRRLIVIGNPEEGFASIEDMFQDSGDLFDENIDIIPSEDIFVLPFSSGTTGPPKGVMLTHSNLCSNMAQVGHPGTMKVAYCPATSSDSSDLQEVLICVLPFFHMYGMLLVMLSGLDHGAKLVTLPRFESASYLNSVHQHRPSALHLAPPLVSLLGLRPDLKLEAFHRLHTVIVGAAPLGPAAATRFIERLRKPDLFMQEGYGMTETSCVCHVSPIVNSQIGSFGEPLSRTQVKVVDLVTGLSLGPGQHGEVCIKGPQLMKGYYKNEKATKETIDSDGWLHTGDMAYYNEQNQFFIVDRLKELIKVKGFQVAPSELEDILRRIPGILDVAVIGVPDDIAGELPRAYVVKKESILLTEKDIIEFVDAKVSHHKRLKGGVVFLDVIPKTATGKILRRELKSLL